MKFRVIYFYILAFFVLCIQSMWMHKNFPIDHWRNELHADKSGYYLYLPAVFMYDFSARKIPPNVEKTLGNSFHIDTVNNKIIDKYFCAVSYMEAPFFFMAHLYAKSGKTYPADGFSKPYQKCIDIAAVFYMVLGFYLLHLALLLFFNNKGRVVISTLLLTFLGTNIYFYGIMDTGMSHIYSFFLFAAVIFLLTHREKIPVTRFHILLSLACWMIVMVRPLNAFFLLILLSWNAENFRDTFTSFKEFFKPKIFSIWLLCGVLVSSPQLAYWYYIRGQYIYYTYGNQTFDKLFSPVIGQFLFAPNNGLIPYSLIIVFMITGLFILARSRTYMAYTSLLIFLLVIYSSSSWWDPKFGCGCGQRNMVEYYALLAFPLGALVNHIYNMRSKYIFLGILFLIAFLNFKIVYHYWGCYFYDTWDWKYYKELVRYNNKYWGPY